MLHFGPHEAKGVTMAIEAGQGQPPEDKSTGEQPTGEQPAEEQRPLRAKPRSERVRDILARPRQEWPLIAAEPATAEGILKSYVLVLAAIPPVAAAVGILVFGIEAYGVRLTPSPVTVVLSAVVDYLFALVGLFLLALIIDALAPQFGGTRQRVRAFKVAAYSSTPAWLAGFFNVIPDLAWLSLIGAAYSLYLLYLGLPLLMRVPEDKAVSYTIVTVIAAVVLILVVGAFAGSMTAAFL